MTEAKNTKRYDLEERTFLFARAVIAFTNIVPKTLANIEMIKQVVRSSGSIGANYIEANESLGKKDFALRIRICRKEAKETVYWLKLLESEAETVRKKQQELIQESTELTKIFGSIVEKLK
jgi:four helix bundle protein